MRGRAIAIVVAAGRGTRCPGAVPKQFRDLGGRPLVAHSLATLAASPWVSAIHLVVPAEDVRRLAHDHRPEWIPDKVQRILAGGPRRQDSVRLALEGLEVPGDTPILVHDAARPFVSLDAVERVVGALARHPAAVLGLPPADTVKRVAADGTVQATLARSELRAVQTPQGFRLDVLRQAHLRSANGLEATDDAALVEACGVPVIVLEGDETNFKVTGPADLQRARPLAQRRRPEQERQEPSLRVGEGYDLHRLVEGRPLILGGVRLPSDVGLAGHSDADVLSHAVANAVLGAAGCGDIGQHFPPDDPRFEGMSSLLIVRRAVALAAELGLSVVNVDCTVVCARPRISTFKARMAELLAGALDCHPRQVNLKATTDEGVGPCGRGEAVSARAVVLLQGGAGP